MRLRARDQGEAVHPLLGRAALPSPRRRSRIKTPHAPTYRAAAPRVIWLSPEVIRCFCEVPARFSTLFLHGVLVFSLRTSGVCKT